MTREEIINSVNPESYGMPKDAAWFVTHILELAGLAPWTEPSEAEVSASVARLDARMEAKGLIRPLEERASSPAQPPERQGEGRDLKTRIATLQAEYVKQLQPQLDALEASKKPIQGPSPIINSPETPAP